MNNNADPRSCLIPVALLVFAVVLFFLVPDWVFVCVAGLATFALWFTLLRYVVMKTVAGDILFRIPKDRALYRVLVSGLLTISLGVFEFLDPHKAISLTKEYAFGVLLISHGLFTILEKYLYTEIRQHGILHEGGGFYSWRNIGSFCWRDRDNTLQLDLRSFFLRRQVRLAISPLYKKEIVAYLQQNIGKEI